MSEQTQLVFGPVGHCIYCRAEGVHLSREHVMPFGLHGEMVLLKSSCDNCATKTGQIENFVLGKTLIKLRIRYGLKSRKKAKNKRPQEFEFHTQNLFSMYRKTKTVNGEYLPWYAYNLPKYDLPGLLLERAPEECTKAEISCVISKFDVDNMLALGDGSESVGGPSDAIDLSLFNRFLAKVAYSYLCAVIGEGNFDSPLPKLILEGHPHDKFWVGCGEDEPAAPFLFEINHGEYTLGNEAKVIAVRIRLFSFLGTPTYIVAAGSRRCDEEWFFQQAGYALPAKISIKDADGVPLFSCGI